MVIIEEIKEELKYRINCKSYFAVCIKNTDKVIGNIYFNKDSKGNSILLDTYEYGILKSEWNK